MAFTDGNMSPADVAAVTGNSGFGSFGGDGAWLILILLLFAAFNGNGWGGYGNGGAVPYQFNNMNNDVQRGFDQQAVMSGIQAIQGGQADAQVAQCNQTMNLMNSLYGIQTQAAQNRFDTITTLNAGHNAILAQLAQCCCDNKSAIADVKYTIATEACNNRQALANSTQAILDKMCEQEIENLKAQNQNLQTQLNMANLSASQTAQTAQLLADNAAQTALIRTFITPTTTASTGA